MRTFFLLTLLGLITIEQPTLSQPVQNQTVRSPRAEFVARMAKVKHGMDATQVRELLGNPDYIIPLEGANPLVKEEWKYGADRGDGLATLGCVWFDTSGKVGGMQGNNGKPPSPELFDETQLRSLLQIIHRSPEYEGRNFDPLTLIQAVNALQPLGKQKALAAIQEYRRVAGRTDAERLFLLLRVLFDVPEVGYAPSGVLGKTDLPPPLDPKLVPLFPIVMVDDIPLMLVTGYDLEGHGPSVGAHIL